MKALEWDRANSRHKERTTGRVLSSPTSPVGIEDGDLWIDTDAATLASATRLAATNRYARVSLITRR